MADAAVHGFPELRSVDAILAAYPGYRMRDVLGMPLDEYNLLVSMINARRSEEQ